jgi:alkylation response protein AidB-like acyl-CoA dehydrogenase
MPAQRGAHMLACMSTPGLPKHSTSVAAHGAPSETIGAASSDGHTRQPDRMAVARELGPVFAARAHAHDADNSLVADNYIALKAHAVFSAGVPSELGGGGATHAELCAMLRELAARVGRLRSRCRCTPTSSRQLSGATVKATRLSLFFDA